MGAGKVPLRAFSYLYGFPLRAAMNSLITREHNGAAFTFREDGYFNMTLAAKHYGKHLDDFWRTKDTADYLTAMAETFPHICGKDFWIAKRGVGTWAHPKLAVFFARWLDVRFAVWCDMQIDAGALPESACVHAG